VPQPTDRPGSGKWPWSRPDAAQWQKKAATCRPPSSRIGRDDSECRRNLQDPRNGRCRNRFQTPNTLKYNPLGHYRRSNFAFDEHNNVCGWDEKQQWIHPIRNYHDKPIAFELRLMLNGGVEYTSEVQTVLFDYRTTETKLLVGAGAKKEHPCTVLTHQGTNAKQQRIQLKDPAKQPLAAHKAQHRPGLRIAFPRCSRAVKPK
jgi:hypothetical protein